ncbi:flippase [Paenibacillus baekrokdamisoli]|uniref:Flippase n=1 Tax=Paenibacillus baekrokdamisoli TaxID=1712516 RepID=A0A3G9J4B5_9BACL|nr:flippase [Paenibacillus baekrokdamisoli]MBB3067248.1 O-antigen/teichoic acid export membrane protein [Paenibacillus baekrokdamisoli]BBH19563.1 flippase [Paenibacillus baekrokdamisoli]
MAKVETTPVVERGSSITKRLARGGSISFLINSTGMGLALVMQVMLARMLGAAAYGTYAFVSTIVTFLVFPTKLGYDISIVRLVASFKAKDDWSSIKGLLHRANQFALILSSVVTLGGLAVILFKADSLSNEQLVTYIAGLVTIPLLTLATLRQSALQALKDVLYAQMPEKIGRPIITMGLLLLCSTAIGKPAGAGLAMICFAAAIGVSWIIGAVVLRKRTGPQLLAVQPKYETKSWTSLSISLMVNAGMYLILGQLGVLMMGLMHSETDSGLFSAAIRLATLVSFGVTAVNMTAAPMLSELYATNNRKQLQHVCTTSGRAGFAFAAVSFAVFAIGGKPLLGLFGPEFVASHKPMLLMAAGQLFNAYCGQNGMMTTMTGHQNALTKALSVATVLNVGLNFALIPGLGSMGAAIAATTAAFCWNAAMVIFVYRKMGILTAAWLPSFIWNKLLNAQHAKHGDLPQMERRG